MKIELESPFKETWRLGYLVINKEPRRNVILFNDKKDRSTISYARYMMSVHLGRLLSEDEVVDHINNDQMDDRLENYQIITKQQNTVKGYINSGKTQQMVDFLCGCCGKEFSKKRNVTHLVVTTKKSDYCSKSCAARSVKGLSVILREYRQ